MDVANLQTNKTTKHKKKKKEKNYKEATTNYLSGEIISCDRKRRQNTLRKRGGACWHFSSSKWTWN